MLCPFPGMDPYLERRALWEDVHNALILHLRDALGPALQPHYFVALQERVLLVEEGDLEAADPAGKPDLTVAASQVDPPIAVRGGQQAVALRVRVPVPERVRETYLEVRTPRDERVVTVIELLSLANKLVGEQRREYERKRNRVLSSSANLVEIDLLRAGRRMPLVSGQVSSHYAILVSRAQDRPEADLLAFQASDPIPTFRLPLDAGREEPEVDLGRLLHEAYERAVYALRIDYDAEPPRPVFQPDELRWIRQRIADSRAVGEPPPPA